MAEEQERAPEWRPRRGQTVWINGGRQRADVLLSDPEHRMALVRTRLNERLELPWCDLAQEQAA